MRTFTVVTVVTFLLAGCNSQPTEQQAQSSTRTVSVSSTAALDTLAWETYTNEKYGFSVQHPPETTIEESDGYIRLQNYVPDDAYMGLERGHYYLEIHASNEPEFDDVACEDSLEEGREVQINGFKGCRGLGEGGGDGGGMRFVLFVETPEKYFFVMATENHENGPIANAILDSFLLTR